MPAALKIPHYERVFAMFPDEPALADRRYATQCRDEVQAMVRCVDAGRYRDSTLWEPFTELFLREIARGRCVLDVGAERGFYSYLAARHMPVGGRVIAVEADPVRSALLAELFAADERVTVVPAAAAESAGRLRMVKPRGCSSTAAAVEGDAFEVQTVALDDVAVGVRVDVVKMDIEGGEAAAIAGMQRILREDRPVLFLEYHPWVEHITPGGTSRMKASLDAAGYSIYRTDTGEPVPADRLGGRMYIVPAVAARLAGSSINDAS